MQSFFSGDADNHVHDDVIWNAAHAWQDKVDEYVDGVGCEGHQELSNGVPTDVSRKVDGLKVLRVVAQEIAIQMKCFKLNNKLKSRSKRFKLKADQGDDMAWSKMVQDLDKTLHCFDHRHNRNPPKFKPKNIRVLKAHLQEDASDDEKDKDDEKIDDFSLGQLETSLKELPQLQPFQVSETLCSFHVSSALLNSLYHV